MLFRGEDYYLSKEHGEILEKMELYKNSNLKTKYIKIMVGVGSINYGDSFVGDSDSHTFTFDRADIKSENSVRFNIFFIVADQETINMSLVCLLYVFFCQLCLHTENRHSSCNPISFYWQS